MSTTTTNLGLIKLATTDPADFTAFGTNFDSLDTYFTTSSIKGLTAVGTSGNGTNNGGRWVGTTTSGAPTSGTYVLGDYVVTQAGGMWICTTAGSPGTWQPLGMVNVNSGTNIIRVDDGTAPTSNASAGIHIYSQSGRGKIRDGVGNVWNLDSSQFFRSTSTTATSSTSLGTINNLSTTLQAGTYVFESNVLYNTAATTTGMRMSVAFSGTQTSFALGIMQATAAGTTTNGSLTTPGSLTGSASVGPGATVMPCQIFGTIVVTVSGTLSVQCASGVNTSTVTAQIGSYLRVARVA